MLIDVNTYAGHWPFRALEDNTLQAVCDKAEEYGITHIVTASLNAVFYRNPEDGNRELMEEIKNLKSPVKVLPLAVVNPSYPNWEKHAHRAIAEEGFVGFEIFPQYHGYGFKPVRRTDKPYYNINYGAELLKLAKELDVPVRINMAFENFRQRHHMDVTLDPSIDELYTMISACPGAKLIINSTLPYHLGVKMDKLIAEGNIMFDISRIDGHIMISAELAVESYGTDVLCFGSMMPFQYPDVNLLKLGFVDVLAGKGIEENAKRFFPNL